MKLEKETTDAAIGLAILILFVVLSYFAGRSDGRGEQPQNAALDARLERIEKAFQSNRECQSLLLQAERGTR